MVRIGLVDDDSEHLKLMREFLGRYEREEKVGFSIEEYRDGLSFVEDYDGTLDVVFLDIEMPHIDGMTAAKKIRERDQTLGIVFVTNMAQFAIHGYEVNAIDFIVKPVSYYVFADKLKKAIRFSCAKTEKELVVQTEESIVKPVSYTHLDVYKRQPGSSGEGAGPGGGSEPGEERLPLLHEPRYPDAHERHYGNDGAGGGPPGGQGKGGELP